MNELKLSDFTDLTVEELALIDKSIHWGRKDYLFNDLYEEQIAKYINTYSGMNLIELASRAFKKLGKINHGYTNVSILWMSIMNDEETRNIFNMSLNLNFINTRPFSDMSDIYILLLADYFVNNKQVDNIKLLKNKYFKDLKKNNMRKNFKAFLDRNMGEVA